MDVYIQQMVKEIHLLILLYKLNINYKMVYGLLWKNELIIELLVR